MAKTNAFIFHGTGGYPEENWFPWLKAKLEERGIPTIVPQFPTPEGQSVKAWLKVLEPYRNEIAEDTILVGHSLGGLFILKYLEQLDHPVRAAFIVAAPIGVRPILNYERDAAFCAGFNFDWPIIKSKAQHFSVFQSDDDPYVSLGNGEELAKQLGVKLSFVPHAGHFNKKVGYTTFDELLEQIES